MRPSHVKTEKNPSMSPQAQSRERAQRVLMFWFEMKPSAPRAASMVRTFVPHVLPMTADMLHGDTKPQLGLEQQLTGQAQRNIRACLHHSHTRVGSMFLSHGRCMLVSRERRDPQVQGRVVPQLHSRVLRCCGVESSSSIRKMRLSGNDRATHNTQSPTRCACDGAPSSWSLKSSSLLRGNSIDREME